jgi:hypothetical protein
MYALPSFPNKRLLEIIVVDDKRNAYLQFEEIGSIHSFRNLIAKGTLAEIQKRRDQWLSENNHEGIEVKELTMEELVALREGASHRER